MDENEIHVEEDGSGLRFKNITAWYKPFLDLNAIYCVCGA